MNKKVILVVDFGTSNVRANLISLIDGTILASAAEKNVMISPATGFSELDPNQLWDNSVLSVRRALNEAERFGSISIEAVTFSYFGDNLIPVDQNGQPVYNCILSFDARGQEQAEEINATLTPRKLVEIVGTEYEAFHTGSKILYLKQKMPEVFEKCAYFYTIQQLVNYRLGLAPMNDETMACRKNMYDLSKRCWSEPLIQVIGISNAQLGEVVPTGAIIGKIDYYGDVKLGNDIPVIIGGHDSDLGIIGLGLSDENEDCIANVTGTFDHIGYLANGNVNLRAENENISMISYLGPLPNTSVCLGAFPTSGALLEWFMREINGDTSQLAYSRLWEATTFDGTGTVMVYPQLSSSDGAFSGIGLATKRIDLFRAVIESLTFETRRIIDECKRTKNGIIRRVRIGGGTAQSPEWLQLRADIMGIVFESTANLEVSSLGAAILAAKEIGVYSDILHASQAMVQVKDIYAPNFKIGSRYEDMYQNYLLQ